MESFEHIKVFKTNITTSSDRDSLKGILDANNSIDRWNVDLNDADNVLRVISYKLNAQQIIEIVNQHGFECHELI